MIERLPFSDLALGEYPFAKQNRRAVKIVEEFAAKLTISQGGAEVGSLMTGGVATLLPVSGMGSVAVPTTLVAILTKHVEHFQELAVRLGEIYLPDTRTAVDDALLSARRQRLAQEFNRTFASEVAAELMTELTVRSLISALPIIGRFASIGLGVAVVATVTWRVGVMVAAYFHLGGRWLKSRKETYQFAASLTGMVSAVVHGRAKLEAVAREPTILQSQVEQTKKWIKKDFKPDASLDSLVRGMRQEGYPREIVRTALIQCPLDESLVDKLISSVYVGDEERKADEVLAGGEGRLEAYLNAAQSVDASRTEGAIVLQKAINEFLSGIEQGKIENKKAIAVWLNAQLEPRGYGLKCPNTGAASKLMVIADGKPTVGAFRFYHMEEGQRIDTAKKSEIRVAELISIEVKADGPVLGDERWTAKETAKRQDKAGVGEGKA